MDQGNKKIKVSVLVNGDDSYGVQLYLANDYEIAKDYGLDCHYVCICQGKLSKELLELGANVTFIQSKPPEPYPPNLIKCFIVFFSHISSYISVYKKVYAYLKECQPDIVYSQRTPEHVIGGLASKSLGIKTVGHFHGVLNKKRNFGLSRRLVSWLLGRCLDMGISISETVRQSYCKRMRDKTYCVYNGLDIRAIEHRAKELAQKSDCNKADIVTVGRLVGIKKQHLLIKAIKILSEKGLELSLLIVGGPNENSNPYYRKLKKQVISYGLSDHVKFLGYVEEPHGIVANSKVSVLCCDREGFGYVVVESMACGTAVVVPDIGGQSEFIENNENGLKFTSDNAAELADCIQCLLEDQQFRQKLTENAFACAKENFTLESHMAQLRQRFDEAIKGAS